MSDSPDGEQALNVLDGDSATKYLNFGALRTGFIVTPDTGATTLQSFTITTANDAPERDPIDYIIQGTNDSIISAEHSNGRQENWTTIAMGDITEISAAAGAFPRFSTISPIGFSNASSYASYRMIFPNVQDAGVANSMQVADVGFFSSMDGTGTNLLAVGDSIIPIQDIDPTFTSASPDGEQAPNAIDADVDTKYLNFGRENSGFIVTPTVGSTVVNGFQITTANDFEGRDPSSWQLFGTNDPITSNPHEDGSAENWTLIDEGSIDLPVERFTAGSVVNVNNTSSTAYSSYRMVFPSVRDPDGAQVDSMQIAEVQFFADSQATLVIDRQTGVVSIRADETITLGSYEVASGSNVAGIDETAWTSIASTGADPNDTWEETAAGPELLAEADTAGGADDGFTLTSGNSYSLGGIWRPLPANLEILTLQMLDALGSPIAAGVEFTGTEIQPGDYNGDGFISILDWPTFRAGYGGDYTGASLADAYFGGDLDGDFDSDIYDFNQFVASAGGFAALFGGSQVPEPSTFVLFAGTAVAVWGVRRLRRFRAAATMLVVAVTVAPLNTALAQSFTNVGGAPTTSIPVGQLNETPDSGPDNLFDDTFLDGAGIIDSELFLLDYNDPDLQGGPFLQYAGLGAGPMTVFMDYGSSVTANWFAWSMRSGGDASADRVGSFEFWFSNSDFGGTLPGTPADAVLNLTPTDPRLFDSVLRPYSLSGDHTGRYVAMRLTLSEASAAQPTNNLGGHEFRLLDGPGDVVLTVDRSNGNMTLSNDEAGAQAIELASYTIESAAGGLVAGDFDGIAGDNGFPTGDGSGNGWEVGGGSNSARLAEAYFSSTSTLAAGSSGISLGSAYNELANTEDLVLNWTNSDGDIYSARVVYVGEAPIFPGDYNNDGVVDAADYPVFRDNLGTDATIPNDTTPGMVTQEDYDVWRQNFGNVAGALGAGVQAVPEPTTIVVAAFGLAAGMAWRRRWR